MIGSSIEHVKILKKETRFSHFLPKTSSGRETDAAEAFLLQNREGDEKVSEYFSCTDAQCKAVRVIRQTRTTH